MLRQFIYVGRAGKRNSFLRWLCDPLRGCMTAQVLVPRSTEHICVKEHRSVLHQVTHTIGLVGNHELVIRTRQVFHANKWLFQHCMKDIF